MSILYIPIETHSRELASRTAIALAALDKGFTSVVIGRDLEVFDCINQPGVVLLKSAASFEAGLIDRLVLAGHRVISLDEEGILPPINDSSVNTRFSEHLLEKLSCVLINGKLELESFPPWVKSSPKIKMTGNPRFDFYSPKRRSFYSENAAKIEQISGGKKIILLVSRFGDVNCADGIDYFELLGANGYLDTEESENFHRGFYNHSKLIFNEFLKLPHILAAKFPDYLIVVRPHPSENSETWQSACNLSNIIVNSQFDIASWLCKSEIMIHNGCTTSIEATAMEIPVISFIPYTSDKYDLVHANKMGLQAKNSDEILSIINAHRSNEEVFSTQVDLVSTIVEYDRDIKASSTISDILYDMRVVPNGHAFNPQFYMRRVKFISINLVRLLLWKFGLKKYYFRRKYPFARSAQFEENVCKVSSALKYKKCSVKRIGIDVFMLESIK